MPFERIDPNAPIDTSHLPFMPEAGRMPGDTADIARTHRVAGSVGGIMTQGEVVVDDHIQTTTPRAVIGAETTAEGPSPYAERKIGDVTYNYNGRSDYGLMFSSVDGRGREAQLTVYQSQSGGARRVSQGLEYYTKRDGSRDIRYIKGPELSPDAQYTQDTQLHPDFDDYVGRVEEDRTLSGMPKVPVEVLDNTEAEATMRDFEAATELVPLGGFAVDRALRNLPPAGHFSKKEIAQSTGTPVGDSVAAARVMSKRIQELNSELARSGVVPNFDEDPKVIGLTSHPVLGRVYQEVHEAVVDGKVYEWHMASDDGSHNVWIERIRLRDAEPSRYGTDRQVVYSGILTTKPLEYASSSSDQCDGLPMSWMYASASDSYKELSGLLSQLAPIRDSRTAMRDRKTRAIG
ncbi:MAG TPA: hypothetical protein VF809_03005 [Candidatus Saccharimonadales bacterium]